ncbi:MAG: 6-phosphofructokinase, partial [Victivallales bacterium]|nr:6-phosphofructokinase [Victivallales bacterium]
MSEAGKGCIGVMTSGGDAQGMNAAVRAVVRTAICRGVDAYAIYDGYQGMVDGTGIRQMTWHDVGGIMDQGGTIIGTARCQEFRERDGRRRAARNLVRHGIDKLVCIGGDGSLTGAAAFSTEWPELLRELLDAGEITREEYDSCPELKIVGMVGSIDNDMTNTDMTIGADTALHRITDAVDALSSTAASHQRTFVVEVMGRNCGYLALASAIATGAGWVLIPEVPPAPGWEERMCNLLRQATAAGRRDSIVIIAEGARDRDGNPITSSHVREILEQGLHRDVRITILGHVQRGGAPSAYDRYSATVQGYRAVEKLLAMQRGDIPSIIGIQRHRATAVPLLESVRLTRSVPDRIAAGDYDGAVALRGSSFKNMLNIFTTMMQSDPRGSTPDRQTGCFAVMTCGWPAAGMNPALRALVRLGLDHGHTIMGIKNGFEGLIAGDLAPMDWMQVEDWVRAGGTALGTNRTLPQEGDFYMIAKNLEKFNIKGLIMIGGWSGYQGMNTLYQMRRAFPAFRIPLVCIPASINNNLPGSELSIGADTALNNIVDAIDKIKHSSDSSRRAFIVEVMGRYCGYLAVVSALSTGAEITYFHEEGVTLDR